MSKKRNQKRAALNNSQRFILDKAPITSKQRFKIEEAYKTIRANIMFSVMKKGCKVIVVTSSLASEGKTTTTANIAAAIAQTEQRVLLIDGDLRKPKIHHYFSVPNAPGLTNYLGSLVNGKSFSDIFSIIHKTDYSNLSVLCSGSIPPNPAELLGSDLMTAFLEEAKKYFDYIIIDTPPINVVSDALPVIRESDGVIVVVRQKQSTHPELQKSLSALEFIDAKILGFIVNGDESKSKKSGYKYSKNSYYGYGKSNSYSSFSPYRNNILFNNTGKREDPRN